MDIKDSMVLFCYICAPSLHKLCISLYGFKISLYGSRCIGPLYFRPVESFVLGVLELCLEQDKHPSFPEMDYFISELTWQQIGDGYKSCDTPAARQ